MYVCEIVNVLIVICEFVVIGDCSSVKFNTFMFEIYPPEKITDSFVSLPSTKTVWLLYLGLSACVALWYRLIHLVLNIVRNTSSVINVKVCMSVSR